MRLAVDHTQLATQALEPDRILEIEELGGEPGGVDVVGVEARSDGPTDQPGVEGVSTVLHEHRAFGEALKPFDDQRYGWCAVEGRGVDAVNTASVRVDPIVAVHERLEAHQVVAHRERDRAELHEVMRRLPGGLAIEGDEVKRLDRASPETVVPPSMNSTCIVERRKRLGARRTESR